MKKFLSLGVVALVALAGCSDGNQEVDEALEGEIAVNEERLDRLEVAEEIDTEVIIPPGVEVVSTPTGAVGIDVDSHTYAMSQKMYDFDTDGDGNVISGVAITPYFKDVEVTYQNAEVMTAVSVEDAFRSGLGEQSQEQIQGFLNDPINLIVVPDGTNEARGGEDAAGWLPEVSQCNYTKTQIDVKARYGLTIDEKEKEAMRGTFDTCGKL